MKTSILIAEPNKKFYDGLLKDFEKSSYEMDVAINGKECQLKAFQKKYSYLVLNFDIQHHTAFEVLNYFYKSKTSTLKIIITLPDSRREEMGVELIKKFGICEVITYPYTKSELIACIDRISNSNSDIMEGFGSPDAPIDEQVSAAKKVTVKYIDKIYNSGLDPASLEYGYKLGNAINQMVIRHKDFYHVLQNWHDYEPALSTHPFLVTLFSMLICKNLNWDSPRTIQVIAMGSLLHDIGVSKLPEELKEYSPDNWTEEQKEMYEVHPKFGLDILQDLAKVPEPIIQIVYQHHETSDSQGYPNRLSDIKIFPLAKVVILANHFARLIITRKLKPFDGLKAFVVDVNEIQKFDPAIMRALIKSFMKTDKEK